MTIDALLARLDRVKQTGPGQWQARCPAHDDRNPSLSITAAGDGHILINDFAGCAPESVLDAIDLTFGDLMPIKHHAAGRGDHAETGFAEAWNAAIPCEIHPYLARKRVRSYGLRQDGENRLLVPMRDVDGKIHGLQRIWPDGDKRHMRGSKVRRHFFQIGELGGIGKKTTHLIICEGYATGATIYEALGWLTIVAFDAGNLEPVANAARHLYPRETFVFAADNDRHTKCNPGLTKAREAARKHGDMVCWPEFRDDEPGSDWNDMEALRGMDAVEDLHELCN